MTHWVEVGAAESSPDSTYMKETQRKLTNIKHNTSSADATLCDEMRQRRELSVSSLAGDNVVFNLSEFT